MCVLVSCLDGAKCSWCLCVFWSLALAVQSVHRLMCVLVSCLDSAKCSGCLCVFWSLALAVQSVHSAYVCFGLLP